MYLKSLLAAVAVLAIASCQTTSSTSGATATNASPPVQTRKGDHVLDWPSQESDLKPDPNVRYGKLPNGLRYAIRVNRTPTHTASFRLRFDVGSLEESDDQRGLAHFLEHMAFNGSKNVPEGEMVRLLQRHGLSFGAHTNAHTSWDETVYELDAPNTDQSTIDTTFMLLRETASNLTIDQAAMDRERGVVLSEERARNSPDYRSLVSEWGQLYPNARFTSRMPIGDVNVLQHAPAQLIRDYYETYYRPNRAFLAISGDFDPDVVEAHIRQTFADWQAARPDVPDPNLGNGQGGAADAYFYDPGIATSVELQAIRPPLLEANTSANVKRLYMRAMANAIITRRLTRLARLPDARFQSGEASDQEVFNTLAASSVALVTRPQDWQAALGVGEQEIRRALQFGFTQAEVNEQVARFHNSFQVAAQQGPTRTSVQLVEEMVNEFGNWGVDMDPADELALFEQQSPEFTPQALQQAFRDEWGGQDPHVFLSTSVAVDNAPQQIAAALAASRRVAVTAPSSANDQAFAYTNFGTPGTVAERHEIADLGITTVRFANNVRLNIKHTDFTHDSIYVSVRFGGGRLELPGAQPGLGMLLSSLPEGGLEAHSADELQSLLAGHNVGASVSAQDDAFVMAGATTGNDLQLDLQLMTAYMTHPGYRPEGLDRFRQTITIQYPTLASTPAGVAQRDVGRLLRSGDPRYGIPPEPQLMSRSFDELKAALANASGHGAIEIGLVGDVDVEQAITMVGATFGALPTRDATLPAYTAERQLTFPQGARAPHVLNHQGQPNRASALIYWPTTDDRDGKLDHTIDLLRAVLQLKLTDRVRESEGATYSPSAQAFSSHANPGFGYIGVSLDLVPDNVNRFFGVVDQIAASLAAGDITADELNRARTPMVNEFRTSLEDNDYWYDLVAQAQSNPDALAQHRTTVADYNAVTVADLRAAARRYLTADKAYRIAILPSATAPAQPATPQH